MVAVVQCASRVGGSPRLPTLRTPPRFGASAAEALEANRTLVMSATKPRRKNVGAMPHLREGSACQQTLGRDAAVVKGCRPHVSLVKREGGGARALSRNGGSPDRRGSRLLEPG